MAIKKINREQLNNKVEAARVVPVEPVQEPVVQEDVVEVEETVEDSAQDVEVEETVEDSAQDVEEPVTPKVVKPSVKPSVTKTTTKPAVTKPATTKTTTKTNANNGGNKMKKTLGRVQPKKVVTERTIGTVYPKDLLLKDIQEKLSDEFDITLADTKKVMDAVEGAVMEACQVASVRFLGGIVKAQDRNALVAKAPRVDYHSYTGARKVITITGGELGQPEKFRGCPNEDNTKFVANEAYNYETGEWEDTNQEIEL